MEKTNKFLSLRQRDNAATDPSPAVAAVNGDSQAAGQKSSVLTPSELALAKSQALARKRIEGILAREKQKSTTPKPNGKRRRTEEDIRKELYATAKNATQHVRAWARKPSPASRVAAAAALGASAMKKKKLLSSAATIKYTPASAQVQASPASRVEAAAASESIQASSGSRVAAAGGASSSTKKLVHRHRPEDANTPIFGGTAVPCEGIDQGNFGDVLSFVAASMRASASKLERIAHTPGRDMLTAYSRSDFALSSDFVVPHCGMVARKLGGDEGYAIHSVNCTTTAYASSAKCKVLRCPACLEQSSSGRQAIKRSLRPVLEASGPQIDHTANHARIDYIANHPRTAEFEIKRLRRELKEMRQVVEEYEKKDRPQSAEERIAAAQSAEERIAAERRAAEEKREAHRIAEVKQRKAREEAEKPTIYDC